MEITIFKFGKATLNQLFLSAIFNSKLLQITRGYVVGVASHLIGWLVVSNICYFLFHIWDNPNPSDELHDFSRW